MGLLVGPSDKDVKNYSEEKIFRSKLVIVLEQIKTFQEKNYSG
jgi:hypothetical protein